MWFGILPTSTRGWQGESSSKILGSYNSGTKILSINLKLRYTQRSFLLIKNTRETLFCAMTKNSFTQNKHDKWIDLCRDFHSHFLEQ